MGKGIRRISTSGTLSGLNRVGLNLSMPEERSIPIKTNTISPLPIREQSISLPMEVQLQRTRRTLISVPLNSSKANFNLPKNWALALIQKIMKAMFIFRLMKAISSIVQKGPTIMGRGTYILVLKMEMANGCHPNIWSPSARRPMNFVLLSPAIKSFYSSPEVVRYIGFRPTSLTDIGDFRRSANSSQLTALVVE